MIAGVGVGRRIRAARKAKGYTLEQLAHIVDVSIAAVSKWEADEFYPKVGSVLVLCQVLDMTPNTLLGWPTAAPAATQQKR